MLPPKIIFQCFVILFLLLGFNFHVLAGQRQLGRASGSPIAQPSNSNRPQAQPTQPVNKRKIKKAINPTPAAQPKPQLTGVNNSGCVYPGDVLALKGRSLGRPGLYNLYLQIDGKRINLTKKSKQWSSNQIQIPLPRSIASGLSRKGKATVGFQQHKGRWLTSVDFNLCVKTKAVKSSPQTKPGLLKVENVKCIRPGDILRLKGKNLGKQGSYRLSMKAGGTVVDLSSPATRKQWTNNRIQLQLPQSLGTNPPDAGKGYIGLLDKKGNRLDSIQFTICSDEEIKVGPAQEVTYTGLPDLVVAGYGVEEAEPVPLNIPPNGYSMVRAINYVITIANIGEASAKKNNVLIEWFDPDGGECPFNFRYQNKLHGCRLKRPINLTPAQSPGFHISNSQQKIIIGPIPVFGKAKEVGWRITLDVDVEIIEQRKNNNIKTFVTREPRIDLLGKLQPRTMKGLDSITIVPQYLLVNSGYDSDPRVFAGPSKVLFECVSLSGFKCPSVYPIVVDFGYLQSGGAQMCNKIDNDCLNAGILGQINAEERDLFATNTELLIKATADIDNKYPEINENNNKAYASISWTGNEVKISDGSNASAKTYGFGRQTGQELEISEPPPQIITALVMPEESPVPLTPGVIQPGSTILLGGKRFTLKQPAEEELVSLKEAGSQVKLETTKVIEKGQKNLVDKVQVQQITHRQRILLIGDFGVRELQDVEWYNAEKAKGVVPTDINESQTHTAYLRIVREDGKQSPPKDIDFITFEKIQLDLTLAAKLIQVDRCGVDANRNSCNRRSYNDDGTAKSLTGSWDDYLDQHLVMWGSHTNEWGDFAIDKDYDKYTIKLKNGWVISKVSFERGYSDDHDLHTKILSYTSPSTAEGRSEWTARVDWQIDPGYEFLWYGYSIEIVGPKGTLPY